MIKIHIMAIATLLVLALSGCDKILPEPTINTSTDELMKTTHKM